MSSRMCRFLSASGKTDDGTITPSEVSQQHLCETVGQTYPTPPVSFPLRLVSRPLRLVSVLGPLLLITYINDVATCTSPDRDINMFGIV